MLKTLSIKLTKLRKGGVGVSSDSRARRSQSKIDGSGMDDVEVDSNEVEVDEFGKKVQKLSKSKNLSKPKKTVRSLDFFTFGTKLVFTKLRQAFIKALILHQFNSEHHIRVETDASGYIIDGVFS